MIGFGKELLDVAKKMSSKTAKSTAKKAVKKVPGVKRGVNFGRNTVPGVLDRYGSTRLVGGALSSTPTAFKKSLVKSGVKPRAIRDSVMASKARNAARIAEGNIPKGDFFPTIGKMGSGKKRALGVAGLGVVSAAGFVNGVDDKNQVSNAVYDLAFNDPNYDEYVMGKKMGLRSLLAPLPGEVGMRSITPRTYASAWQANRKSKPRADGSTVFGMYNARLG